MTVNIIRSFATQCLHRIDRLGLQLQMLNPSALHMGIMHADINDYISRACCDKTNLHNTNINVWIARVKTSSSLKKPEEPSRSRLDEWFLPGRRQAPRQRSAPFFPEVHEELTKSWRAPYSARLHTTHRSALTTVDGSEEKGYEHLPPLDEAVAAHPCPPAAVGWKTKRALPSKPCRTTSTLAGRAYTSAGQAASALHTMAIFQVFQAKLLRSLDESGIDAPAFRDLRSATDLALRATKATAQAIGRFHRGTKVVSGHETLFAQALQLRLCFKPPQACAGSAEQACPLYLSGSAA
ncbi:hypothetical protein DPX16_15625 [Anabarilius grahami]|uniref:Uncharacterized protein n=1 Tax=Anabarilius grahami TaxID=495550 RepID=A0A3N0YD33_ANAGA|nr:hypothetical protein DPX16_15625 [Anabarilius grahami]